MKKMLVVYYSWSNGNTKRIAEQLTNGTGADIARIETTEPYSGSHEDVVEQGKREVEAGFMPQINPISVNLADYDVIATSYIAQVKRMCGLDMGENYNKSKKGNLEVKKCPQEKVEYIKDAMRHFNMI